jgi:hypothetical protein
VSTLVPSVAKTSMELNSGSTRSLKERLTEAGAWSRRLRCRLVCKSVACP